MLLSLRRSARTRAVSPGATATVSGRAGDSSVSGSFSESRALSCDARPEVDGGEEGGGSADRGRDGGEPGRDDGARLTRSEARGGFFGRGTAGRMTVA